MQFGADRAGLSADWWFLSLHVRSYFWFSLRLNVKSVLAAFGTARAPGDIPPCHLVVSAGVGTGAFCCQPERLCPVPPQHMLGTEPQ